MSSYTDKKGVSEIVAYVVLIAIALSISVLVFSYLKVYVPKDKPQCSEDVSIRISDFNCSVSAGNTTLTLTLENRGLFNIDAAYIRFGQKDKTALPLIIGPDSTEFFIQNPIDPSKQGLPPSNYYTLIKKLNSTLYPLGQYKVEAQAATYVNKKLVLCESAISTQEILCK